MYNNKITQNNLKKISELGYDIIPPEKGELASGLYGLGKMPEPETIFDFVNKKLLKKKDLTGKKVLITAGPTIEQIDSVRFISNYSSGKMGFEIARAAYERGADVTLISGPVKLENSLKIKRIDVNSSDEMFNAVKKEFTKQDIIVMAAAVADFKPVNKSVSKIKKEKIKNNFLLELERTPDILKYLGDNKKNYFLVGFALETDNEIENAKAKLKQKNLDMIVLNNPNKKGAGFGTDTNIVTFIDRRNITEFPLISKFEVGNAILDFCINKKSAK
jgi:phosphopantothenoylcysteine decarboxylase/phosphopantothenate--cysteine ligase